ncbi:hypothetical protein CANTEDRAFT_113895 [Yamadazyma tenuis ATCC 10573]|uniref:Acyl-CoA N-acyltransferase n=1 Tax=Candida tenuis (strain ATCC 10573 / BCRC 21748 / CBS 615 / JCM 9827 / NBRC 10315 / NRRL Y-1498 / VKM Y-70) TaxID=590646 RepID=G3B4U1_CANTC|nr:acyl-CoA N-acyltransferase [Yamadazyma tenuis ATCC 10573]XP_006686586.1 uncharacterized protein CANTEDRAFT_113895 [Yamadazyma tenuis ATCC 10573]EGV64271.1 acyl-CoA N-acyltransferase [Yamadazyma tenuis ATCC 10573]EGV64272.1 hypothetical protein CANTEDRAFT_113895 [Yamadazyma tenuis ATCC 10573]
MTSYKPFQLEDLYDINSINLDPLTENYPLDFYSEYLIKWPSLFFKSVEISDNSTFGDTSEISGYMIAKNEGKLSKLEWHTHISAVTIHNQYRRVGLASDLCIFLENIVNKDPDNTLFIDLFVRVTNTLALQLYEKLGYSIYRRVVGYYGRNLPQDTKHLDDEIDGYDMRKSLPADVNDETIRLNGHKVCVLPQDVVF